MKEIKTKSNIKDIKVLDKTADVSRRMKNAYIRTKDKAKQLGYNDDGNYVDEAGNSIQEGMEIVTRKTGHTAGNYGKKLVQKIKESCAPDTNASHSDTPNGQFARQASKSEVKKAVCQNAFSTETKQATKRNISPFKTKETVMKSVCQPVSEQAVKHNVIQSTEKKTTKREFTLSKPSKLAKRRFVKIRAKQRLSQSGDIRKANQNIGQRQSQQISERIPAQCSIYQPTRKTVTQPLHTFGKTGGTMKQSAKTGGKSVKKTAKSTIKTAQRSVKTAKHTAKATIKTSQAVAKTAVKTAQNTRRVAQVARIAARAAAVSTKMALKAIVVTIKAIIASVKGLIALIAAGGWTAFIIILVICLAGLFTCSGFGIFYSNESSSENTPVMTEIVNQLNEEFTAELEHIQNKNPHDTLKMSDSSTTISNWRNILAVYAVKVAANPENGMDVATLDVTKVKILRNIFWDMNKIDYWIETTEHVETVTTTDEDGNEIQETIITTEIILYINVTSKSSMDMIVEYSFDAQQVKMLNELMQDEYQQLFMRLISSG